MRMLLKISLPVEKANEAAKSGALKQSIEATMKALKPEAAYFYAEDGKRSEIIVFDMQGSWQLPPMLEPLFQNLGAAVHLTPVMNSEDLQRGFKEAGM
jgi:hypothetical protein